MMKYKRYEREEWKMRIEFTTREYMRDHGRMPKGRGYWGFEYEGYEFWAYGTLSEAKKACKEDVKKNAPKGYVGIVYVNVLP